MHVEVTYMLGGEPAPGGFLSHIVGHAKMLPLYIMEEGGCQALHLDFFLQVMHDLIYSAPPFMPSHGFSLGIPSPYWSNDDVIPLPFEALPPLGESSNQ